MTLKQICQDLVSLACQREAEGKVVFIDCSKLSYAYESIVSGIYYAIRKKGSATLKLRRNLAKDEIIVGSAKDVIESAHYNTHNTIPTHIDTSSIITDKHNDSLITAYRLLLEEGVVEGVEITGMTEESFSLIYPYKKDFFPNRRKTSKGFLLI